MKKAWLHFAGELAVPGVRVLRREGALQEVETSWFPRQLRSQLDRHGARGALILTFGRFVIDTPKVTTPHPRLLSDARLCRDLGALDAGIVQWLQTLQGRRTTTERPS